MPDTPRDDQYLSLLRGLAVLVQLFGGRVEIPRAKMREFDPAQHIEIIDDFTRDVIVVQMKKG